MKSHDVRAALASVPELDITASTTAEEASAAVRELGWLSQLPRPCVSMLFATPAKTREISFGDDLRPAA